MKNNQSFSNLSEGEGQPKFKPWLTVDLYLIWTTTHPSDSNTSWQSGMSSFQGCAFPITCQTAAGWLLAEGFKEQRKTRGHQWPLKDQRQGSWVVSYSLLWKIILYCSRSKSGALHCYCFSKYPDLFRNVVKGFHPSLFNLKNGKQNPLNPCLDQPAQWSSQTGSHSIAMVLSLLRFLHCVLLRSPVGSVILY